MNLAAWIRTRRPTQVYYGWWIVAASSAMTFFASGIFFRGFSVFFIPVRDTLGINNFQASLVFSLARAEGGLEGPAAGWMIDRFGMRKLVIGGILLAALGYFAFAFVDSFLAFALVYLGVIALGNSICFQHAFFAGFNMWFIRRRAFVMSLLAGISSLGGVILIPVVNVIILNVGWEWAAIIGGFTYLLIILPLTLVLRPSPESMGLLPDGDRPQEGQLTASPGGRRGAAPSPASDPREFTVSEALHTPAYWLLLLGIGLRQLAVIGILVNLQPILKWKGADLETVGYLLSLMMGVNVVARIALGFVADKLPKSLILASCLASECIAVVFLLTGSWESSPWAIFLYLVLAGVGDSAGVICWAAVGDFYGRRKFATLRGIITFSHSWALIVSPMFVGLWADRTGGYELPMWIAIIVLGIASLCFTMLRRPRRRLPGGVAPGSPRRSGT